MSIPTVPTPVAIFSSRVQIHLNEIREQIAVAMSTGAIADIDKKFIKLQFDVKVSPECWSFFYQNGHTLLHLSGWDIDDFTQIENDTIEITVTGAYSDNNYR